MLLFTEEGGRASQSTGRRAWPKKVHPPAFIETKGSLKRWLEGTLDRYIKSGLLEIPKRKAEGK